MSDLRLTKRGERLLGNTIALLGISVILGLMMLAGWIEGWK